MTDWSHVCEGDYVHFTKFAMTYDQKDVWGVCTFTHPTSSPEFYMICDDERETDMDGWPAYSSDHGRVVPENEVPDHVWVTLAKRRLTE